MQNNIFLGGSDPLLGNANTIVANTTSYEDELAKIQQMQQALEQKRQEVCQLRPMVGQTSNTPIWDEIDNIVSGMSDADVEYMTDNEEFQASNAKVMAILQREYLRMMRPMVEGCTDGKAALTTHLDIVRRLKKDAANESDKALNLFREYTEKYSTMTYSEFLKLKNKEK